MSNILIDEFDSKINDIAQKFNYDEKMCQLLMVVAKAMIIYYGYEKKDTILNSLSNVYIHIQKDDEDATKYLSEYFGEHYEFNSTPGLVKSSFTTISTLENGKVSKKEIIYISKEFNKVNLTDNNPYSDFSFQVFIHELNHCIKNNHDAIILSDTEYELINGINRTVFSAKNIPYDMISDNYDCLEEAINTIQEWNLFSIITGRYPVKANGYRNISNELLKLIEKYPLLYTEIVKSEFNGDKEWLKYIGEDNALLLDEIFQRNVQYTSYDLKDVSFVNNMNIISNQISDFMANKVK